MDKNLQQQYFKLAAELGDTEFRMQLLAARKQQLVASIQEINNAVDLMKRTAPAPTVAPNEAEAEKT